MSDRRPVDAATEADRGEDLPSCIKLPTALDGAASVFGLLPSAGVLKIFDVEDLDSYEDSVAAAWQHVGDSMRAALSTR